MGLQNKAGQPGREPGACKTQHGQWGQQRAQEERERGAGRDREELTKMKLVLLSRIILRIDKLMTLCGFETLLLLFV